MLARMVSGFLLSSGSRKLRAADLASSASPAPPPEATSARQPRSIEMARQIHGAALGAALLEPRQDLEYGGTSPDRPSAPPRAGRSCSLMSFIGHDEWYAPPARRLASAHVAATMIQESRAKPEAVLERAKFSARWRAGAGWPIGTFPARRPGVLFCGGYTSDMTGTKASALERVLPRARARLHALRLLGPRRVLRRLRRRHDRRLGRRRAGDRRPGDRGAAGRRRLEHGRLDHAARGAGPARAGPRPGRRSPRRPTSPRISCCRRRRPSSAARSPSRATGCSPRPMATSPIR